MLQDFSLDANAPPFYPSSRWYSEITDDYYLEHPHSPGTKGFVIADNFDWVYEVPDEELFNPAFFPLSNDEMAELEQVDEINEMLAELDVLETHEELHHKLQEVTRATRANSDVEGEIHSRMTKSTKCKNNERERAQSPRMPKKQLHCHSKNQVFVPLQQPRSVS
jgi:hypothetical protein